MQGQACMSPTVFISIADPFSSSDSSFVSPPPPVKFTVLHRSASGKPEVRQTSQAAIRPSHNTTYCMRREKQHQKSSSSMSAAAAAAAADTTNKNHHNNSNNDGHPDLAIDGIHTSEPFRQTLLKKFLGDQLKAAKRAKPKTLRTATTRLPRLDETAPTIRGIDTTTRSTKEGAGADDALTTVSVGTHAKWWTQTGAPSRRGPPPSYPPTAITERYGPDDGTPSEVAAYQKRVEQLEAQMAEERARRAATEQQMAELMRTMKSDTSRSTGSRAPSVAPAVPPLRAAAAAMLQGDTNTSYEPPSGWSCNASSVAGNSYAAGSTASRMRPNPITGRLERNK